MGQSMASGLLEGWEEFPEAAQGLLWERRGGSQSSFSQNGSPWVTLLCMKAPCQIGRMNKLGEKGKKNHLS